MPARGARRSALLMRLAPRVAAAPRTIEWTALGAWRRQIDALERMNGTTTTEDDVRYTGGRKRPKIDDSMGEPSDGEVFARRKQPRLDPLGESVAAARGGLSADVTTAAAAAANSMRRPNCARCRNHFETVPLKGHKRFCQRKGCVCHKCLLTEERQRVMAKQTALRRKQVQDEQRIKQGLPIPVSPPPDSSAEVVAAAGSLPSPPPVSVPNTPSSSNGHNYEPVRLESIFELLDKFQYQLDAATLIYIILRDVTSDISDAYRRILDGFSCSLKKVLIV